MGQRDYYASLCRELDVIKRREAGETFRHIGTVYGIRGESVYEINKRALKRGKAQIEKLIREWEEYLSKQVQPTNHQDYFQGELKELLAKYPVLSEKQFFDALERVVKKD